eukprot:CAMPEP_0206136362 /NCGR_PEP_ID=MMETSP1473-20131121/1596_1 /ASSEMBLY_ACC=CAM_ASM_001109 /TAXON_ID=1461547 /ORGANISM="Stichococcus sp, Strain RCC1054" /LENGTH=1201 /DNA_ID=CAMNT_0053528837 /DNA_START=280 /DNA_END=3885 /DNA_ORIENTATION=+
MTAPTTRGVLRPLVPVAHPLATQSSAAAMPSLGQRQALRALSTYSGTILPTAPSMRSGGRHLCATAGSGESPVYRGDAPGSWTRGDQQRAHASMPVGATQRQQLSAGSPWSRSEAIGGTATAPPPQQPWLAPQPQRQPQQHQWPAPPPPQRQHLQQQQLQQQQWRQQQQQQQQTPRQYQPLPPAAVPEENNSPPDVEGTVKKVQYRSAESGYTVLKVKPSEASATSMVSLGTTPAATRGGKGGRGRGGLITVTGIWKEMHIAEGQQAQFWGDWVDHRTYGRQLMSTRFLDPEPDTPNQLIAYLSECLPGVGPVIAKRLCEALGKDHVLSVLNNGTLDPDQQRPKNWQAQRLRWLKGCGVVGAAKAEKMCADWDASAPTRDAEALLKQSGFTPLQSVQIVKHLVGRDQNVRELIERNPYLTMECGVSFKLADHLAVQLGLAPNMSERGAAAIRSELKSAMQRNGHCYVRWGELQNAAFTMLYQTGRSWPDGESLEDIARKMNEDEEIVVELGDDYTVHKKWLFRQPQQVKNEDGLPQTPTALQLNNHLIQNVSGVGPHALKELYKHFQTAEQIIAMMDRPDSEKLLIQCSGIGPDKAGKIKKSWQSRNRDLLKHMPAQREAELAAPSADAAKEQAVSSAHQREWDPATTRCYTPELYRAETIVAATLARLAAQGRKPIPAGGMSQVDVWMTKNEKHTGISLSNGQKEAIRQAANAPVMVLTGGPGCGKTFATATIVKLWRAMSNRQARISLCAPTGRAAERLAATTRLPATTIHRMLKVRGRKQKPGEKDVSAAGISLEANAPMFGHHSQHPLPADAVLVDEASMVDLPLAAALLDAAPRPGRTFQLVLVGDADQLPPVGPGSVLQSIIQSGRVPVVNLREIFRQEATSAIVRSAHEINSGIMPVSMLRQTAGQLQLPHQLATNAQWLEAPERGAAVGVEELAVQAVLQLKSSGMDVARDLQVLTPMKAGPAGTRSLNLRLQALLNPPDPSRPEFQRRPNDTTAVFRVGDRVIQVVNDYDREVFNGDQGFVQEVGPNNSFVTVAFDSQTAGQGSSGDISGAGSLVPSFKPGAAAAASKGDAPKQPVKYTGRQADMLELAWVTTVHKAQGGESQAVLMCLAPSHRPLLSRRLFYTGLTRAKSLAVVVATPAALHTAVQGGATTDRACCLQERFEQEAERQNVAQEEPLVFHNADSEAATQPTE